MSIKKMFQTVSHHAFGDTALLLIRLLVGMAFILHGWPKIQNPLAWMGPEAPVPGILQALAALSEFGGGIAWMLGLLTPLASFGIACTMATAFATHTFMKGHPFVSMSGGPASELAAVYFAISIVIFAMGPGRYSVDSKAFGWR